ncbi:glycosyltransferase [Streptomyces sp. NPDC003077]|uniref:glycosyltransferase family A protein n=1 Tax=Streptomyces sp. NPDC003077 TaxID=3154443 RepID=UPI0033AADDB6
MHTPTSPATPELAVVIPFRGDPARLRATLACLAGAIDAPAHEVIIVDDDDTEDPAAEGAVSHVLAEAAQVLPLRVVTGPRRGRAAARNAGAAAAGAPWLVFLDADVLVGPGFLSAYAAAARPGLFLHGRVRELPAADGLLARLRDSGAAAVRRERAALGSGAAPAAGGLVASALERAVEAMAGGALPDVAPWLGFVGANTAVERAAWRRAGGFDEGFGHEWGCEDLELGLRLHGLGLRRRLIPDALGVHLGHPRPDGWQQRARNMERFARLHPRASVRALPVLLAPDGTPEAYAAAVTAAEKAAERAAGRPAGRGTGRQPAREPGRDNGRELVRDNGRDNGQDTGQDTGRDHGQGIDREGGRDAGRPTGSAEVR